MKLYAIHANPWNWHPEVSFFHGVMFHGEAILPPGRYGSASHNLDESDMQPMQLVVNGFRPVEVFCPDWSCNLVVSERVRDRLEPVLANFLFLPIAFQKVINLPWSLDGRYELPEEYDQLRRDGREMSILKACPHDPQAAAALSPYYEVVAPNHYDLVKRFPPTHRFFTHWYEGEPFDYHLLPVSRAQFDEYPISDPGYTVVRDDIFHLLSPFMEPQFFGIKEFTFE